MSNASAIIIKNLEIFANKKVLITGNLADRELITKLLSSVSSLAIWCFDYAEYIAFIKLFNLKTPNNELNSCTFSEDLKITLYFSAQSSIITRDFDIALLLITKTKALNIAILNALTLKLLPNGALMLAGANDEGIKGMEKQLKDIGSYKILDTARKCRLYAITPAEQIGNEQELTFASKYTFKDYGLNLTIEQLPGVFSAKSLDEGTQMLLTYLEEHFNSIIKDNMQILDVGCGCGIIGLYLKAKNPTLKITATDVSAHALYSAKHNAQINNLNINVFPSDMLKSTAKYDLIISNPPFHAGIEVMLDATKSLFTDAINHLLPNGSLLIVANSFLPYNQPLQENFSCVSLKKATSKFKIYHAF